MNHQQRATRRLSAEALESRRLMAIDLEPVVNLNTSNPWGLIREFEQIGGLTFFVAREPGASRLDLWRTDGTTPGTIRLADLGPLAPNDFSNRGLTNIANTLYFKGFDEAHGQELWKSDGTASGTVLVRDLRAGAASSTLSNFTNLGGTLLFEANGHLTRSRNDATGTVRIADLRASASDEVGDFTVVGNSLYFTAKLDTSGVDLFKSDGTKNGTQLVQDAGSQAIDHLANVGNTLFFTLGNAALWKSQGSPATTLLVSDFSSAPFGAYPSQLTDVNGTLFFSSNGELWKSDGTNAGTVFLKDAGDNAYEFFNHQGTLYFSAGVRFLGNGYELWKSDGTAAGTQQVVDLSPDFDEGYGFSSYPGQFTNVGGTLFFTSVSRQAARGIYTTDGTAAGTKLFAGGFVSDFAVVGNELRFADQRSYGHYGLYKQQLNSTTSVDIARNGPGIGSSDPSTPVDVNGTLYFAASDGIIGFELWRNVGGVSTLVKGFAPGNGGSLIANLMNVNGTLFFTAYDGAHGVELWKSDGTEAGTIRLSDIQASSPLTTPQEFTVVGNQLFFSAFDTEGWELWKSDGTASGTLRVRDIYPGQGSDPYSGSYPRSSFPSGFVNRDGTLFFTAQDAVSGRELWKSDGTSSGTVLVKDLFPGDSTGYPYGINSSNPGKLVNLGGTLYFSAADSLSGYGLWRSDGTAAGTQLIRGPGQGLKSVNNLTAIGLKLFFSGTGATGEELWKSDGTAAGTVQVKDIRAGTTASSPTNLVNVNGDLFFLADDGTHGRELWRSDGTAAGTVLVEDIREGLDPVSKKPFSSEPRDLTSLNGVLFFSANDGTHGRELWFAAVGEKGAHFADDLLPGEVGSDPQRFYAVGNDLYFSAITAAGRELWKTSSAAPVMGISTTALSYSEGETKRIAQTASLNDVDTAVLRGGILRASLVGNADPADRLVLLSGGKLTIQGSALLYDGIEFARFSGGVGEKPLMIRLNMNASVNVVRVALRNIAFRTESQNPSTARRVVQFELTDGEGAAAVKQYAQIDVARVNDAPEIRSFGKDVVYLQGQLNTPVATFAATIKDVDSPNFSGGKLTVAITSGGLPEDRLVIRNTSTLTTSGGQIRLNGILIGTFAGGIGAAPLVVTFNSNATEVSASTVLQNITYGNMSLTPVAGPRTVSAQITDGDGGSSALLSKQLTVTAVATAPITLDTSSPLYSETGAWLDSSLIAYNGVRSRYTTSSAATATWTLTGLPAGTYQVYYYNLSQPLTIKATLSDGTTSVDNTLNLPNSPNGFVSLGTFQFSGSGADFVRLSQPGTGTLRATALRLFRVGP